MDQKKHNYRIILFVGAILFLVVGILISLRFILPSENKAFKKVEQAQATEEASFRAFNDVTVKIAQYELYYRQPFFYSKEEANFYGLTQIINQYALFYYLQQQGVELDEEKRILYEKIARSEYDYLKSVPIMKAYFDTMFEQLEITEQQYIEDYLYPKIEYEKRYQLLFDNREGLEEDSYPTSDAFDAYLELIEISEAELNELAQRIPAYEPPLEEQPNLGLADLQREFFEEQFYVKHNDEGQYVFIDVPIIVFMDEFSLIMRTAKSNIASQELTRVTFDAYKQQIDQFEAVGEELIHRKQQLQTIFDLFETTIESK